MPPSGARFVPDIGPQHARIVIVGEAPGKAENAQGQPFVGPAGWKLNEWLGQAGLRREDCYITNTYPYQPPGNKLLAIPATERAHWIAALHERLGQLTGPHVIVPTGDTALKALTGRTNGILANRGFIATYTTAQGRVVKAIPTIHPAAIFRTPYWERRCLLDWRRIAREAMTPEVALPQWEHVVTPTLSDLAAYYDDVRRKADTLSIDIETYGGQVSCVGFAYSGTFSVTVPTRVGDWPSRADYDAAWAIIKAICALPVPKVLQNGFYDWYWLADFGVVPVNWEWDCLALHHALDAADDHGLSYMASIELRMPPWKHIPKDADARLRFPSDAVAIRTYNGIDNCVQWALADKFAARLGPRLPFYFQHYRDLFLPLLDLMRHGISTNPTVRQEMGVTLRQDCETIQGQLSAIAGTDLRGAKNKKREAAGKMRDLSNIKLMKLFYDQWRFPPAVRRRANGTSTRTLDEIAVRRALELLDAHPERWVLETLQGMQQACHCVLDHRHKKKLGEFLEEKRFDADHRLRSSYGFSPETGRLSSSKNPKWNGANAQNQSREIRRIFIPDRGRIFVEADLSQAEDRIVKVLTASLLSYGSRRDELLWRARAQPHENDEHKRAAMAIFGIPQDRVDARQRYFGKRARHGANYDMHGRRFSDELLKEDVVITPEEGERMIQAVIDRDTPEVRGWHMEIRKRLMRDRQLSNDWGRELDFTYDRLDDETYRRGYAFIPQSSVPAILNQYGFRPLWEAIRAGAIDAAINQNGHDSLLISADPNVDTVWTLIHFLRQSLERSRTYWGVALTIPVEFKVGLNWSFTPGRTFKQAPSRDEIGDAIATLLKEPHHEHAPLSAAAEQRARRSQP